MFDMPSATMFGIRRRESNRNSGITALPYTQVLPFVPPEARNMYVSVEQVSYARCDRQLRLRMALIRTGKHHMSDVFAGAVVGIGVAYIVWKSWPPQTSPRVRWPQVVAGYPSRRA